MDSKDMQGFFANEVQLDRDGHLIFTYWMETDGDPRVAAAALASEQSTAQWRRPGSDEDLRLKFGAKVTGVQILGESSNSAFGSHVKGEGRFTSARVRIAHPHHNFGARLPNLLTAAMGEGVFFSPGISTIKLMDIEFPDSYAQAFEGPKFGTEGLRRAFNVWDRPLFFGVVKPNVGLDPSDFAELAREAWLGGLDAAKDDEMLADPSYSPFAERMKLVGQARREAEQATGEAKMFIANITDEVARLRELHDIAVDCGVNAVMVNVMAVGLSAVRWLGQHSCVPIVAHFDCIAPMSRHPHFGVSTTVLTKLQRLAGCDAIIMPGFGPRMATPEEEVLANAEECTRPLGHIKSVLPVPGGSDWAGTLPAMCEKLKTVDFAMVPGRGVFGHPMGPKAGAASLRQAWEAIESKTTLCDFAADHLELACALKTFGKAPKVPGADRDAALEAHGFTGAPLSFERG